MKSLNVKSGAGFAVGNVIRNYYSAMMCSIKPIGFIVDTDAFNSDNFGDSLDTSIALGLLEVKLGREVQLPYKQTISKAGDIYASDLDDGVVTVLSDKDTLIASVLEGKSLKIDIIYDEISGVKRQDREYLERKGFKNAFALSASSGDLQCNIKVTRELTSDKVTIIADDEELLTRTLVELSDLFANNA